MSLSMSCMHRRIRVSDFSVKSDASRAQLLSFGVVRSCRAEAPPLRDRDPMSQRRTMILDAAVRVLGQAGPRGLTHRAVDREVGLPEGSTSNFFPRRQELLEAITAHLAQTAGDRWQELWSEQEPATARELATFFAGYVRACAEPALADMVRARLYLHLEAPDAIAAANRQVTDEVAERVAAAGADPAQTEVMLSIVDGLLLRAVSFGLGALPNQATMVRSFVRVLHAHDA